MNKNIKKVLFSVLALGMVISSTAVLAGTSDVGYNTTVGRLNGNGYTGWQTKATTGAAGYLTSTSVGGGYSVDARMVDDDGDAGGWARDIISGISKSLQATSNQIKGESIRVQFSNDLLTPVDVQVVGKF